MQKHPNNARLKTELPCSNCSHQESLQSVYLPMLSLVFLCWLLIELMLITVLMQEVDGLVNAADDKYQLTH